MRLRTRTTRRVATAGLALVTAAALTACSSDSDERASGADTSGTETSAPATQGPTSTPVDQLILAGDEAPGGGRVDVLAKDQIREQVEKIVAAQNEQLMNDPACDKVSRVPTVVNHSLEDAVNALVRYKQSETDDTEHRFAVGIVHERMDEFLDRGLYEACTNSTSATNPDKTLTMSVDDAPAVEGAEGFRVISDFVTTQPDGPVTHLRHVSIHGFARGNTVSVEYEASNNDPAVDPVLTTAAGALNAIYTEQMAKIVDAE